MANADARQELIDQLTIKVLGQEVVSKAKATKVVDSLYAAVEDGAAKAVKPIVFKTIQVRISPEWGSRDPQHPVVESASLPLAQNH